MGSSTPLNGEPLAGAELELLDCIRQHFGYDFRARPVTALRQTLRERIAAERLRTAGGLREKVFHDAACRERLFLDLARVDGEMFREPTFFLAFREKLVPFLRTYPFIRIWVVGCATGEEAYSLAIVLQEEGLYERSRIYATDVSALALRRARSGIFSLADMKRYTENYVRAGGAAAFSQYYTADYDSAIFRPALRKNLIVAQHNLATDGTFNEFHVIVCRDLLPALESDLRARVHGLFLDSLVRFGFLCLGRNEPLTEVPAQASYETFDAQEHIYRRGPRRPGVPPSPRP
jgi:chemotaxis protein methyltransferase CheR